MRRPAPTVALRAVAIVALALSATACEWFSTMSDPAGIQPHEREPLPPPRGSIPLDGMPAYTLADVEGLLTNPTTADSASLATGEAYYRDFCSVCHGPGGLGDGSISGIFPAIPSIATSQVAGYSDAYLFALITQGRGLMPEYSRIPKEARWDVVNYVRALGTAGDAVAGAGSPADTSAAGAAATDTTGGAP